MPAIVGLFVVLLWIAGFGGWVANIVQIVGMIYDPLSTMLVLKIVGIFVVPLGSILGIVGVF